MNIDTTNNYIEQIDHEIEEIKQLSIGMEYSCCDWKIHKISSLHQKLTLIKNHLDKVRNNLPVTNEIKIRLSWPLELLPHTIFGMIIGLICARFF